MRPRIWLAGMAAGVLTLAVGVAVAAAAPATTVVLKCTSTISTVPPAGNAAVPQPPNVGWQYGHTHCGKKAFRKAVDATAFTVLLNGNTVGSYTEYFATGTLWGKFTLVPNETVLQSENFTAEQWVGKFTVTGGSGTFQGMKSSGPGVMKCSTPDTVHLMCTEKIRLG